MTETIVGDSRWLKSARLLKAFFESKLKVNLQFLGTAPAELSDGDFALGWEMSRHGIWGLRSADPLTEQHRQEITETFKTIIGAVENMRTQNEELSRLENLIKATIEELPSNVIPIHRSRKNLPARAAASKRWILRLDCLIESEKPMEAHKLAVELYAQSARYAFIDYNDLDAKKRLIPSELLEMGAVSLFVPDILMLTRSEQQVLRHIAEQDTLNRPLLLVASPIAYSLLRLNERIDKNFLALLSRTYIKMTRPFSEYKEQGLIQYFLDSLSQNPS